MVIEVRGHTESRPTHGTSDEEFSGGVHTGHKQLLPPLETGFAPLVGVSGVTSGNASDRKRKGKGHVCGVTICAESDFPACEAIHKLQGRIFTRFPCPPDAQGGLPGVDVATAPASGPVATVDA